MTSGIKVKEQDYIDLATSLGITWLGPMPIKAAIHTSWKCPKGHIWTGTYINLKHYRGGCPTCSIKQRSQKRRITKEQYEQLATEYNYEWLGPYPDRANINTCWKCKLGHEWKATYRDMRHGGTGCPFCYELRRGDSLRFTEQQYVNLAKSRNFIWVGPLPKNSKIKTVWKCDKGHLWKTSYHEIQLGNRCAHCSKLLHYTGKRCSYLQKELADMLHIPEKFINFKVEDYWLDMAYPDEKICIEYDCYHWHRRKKNKDEKRNIDLIKRGWGILRIKSGSYLPDITNILPLITKLRQGSLYEEIVLSDWLKREQLYG